MVLPGFPGAVRNVKSISKYGHLIMRFQQWGCKNRPFYHIVVDKVKSKILNFDVPSKFTFFSNLFRTDDRLVMWSRSALMT